MFLLEEEMKLKYFIILKEEMIEETPVGPPEGEAPEAPAGRGGL